MLRRILVVGAALIALIVLALWSAGFPPTQLLVSTRPLNGSLLVALLACVIAVHLASGGFLLWKFKIQPYRNGFLFNPSQEPKIALRALQGVPVFYDTGSPEFAWVRQLEKNASPIIAEIFSLLNGQDTVAEQTFRKAYDNKVLALGASWRSLNIISYGAVNAAILPKTLDILRRVPNLFTCNLSKMAPHSRLKFHSGESSCYIRCHLGIKIPATAPVTALHVGGEVKSWQEGKVQAFCDAHWHGAVNDSDEARYVLIFDVMPERLAWYTKQFCALMLAFTVTLYLVPGRMSLDEPLWRPGVLLGYVSFTSLGIPLLAALYVYFRYLCRRRPAWLRRLADAGFGFYF